MIKEPMIFEEAIAYLLDKRPNPSEWAAADWVDQRPAIKVRSFFSSRVESARFLDRAQGLIFDYLAKVRDDVTTPSGEKTTALRVGGRADFVMLMRKFMIEEGMADPDEFKDVNPGDVSDLRSLARLNLIFDTNVRQAYGYGQWRQGMKPVVRQAFPAARFVRVRGVVEPRPRHAASLGEVRLKTDNDYWARYQNDPEIGGFGVPWGPYGFHSGMGQEDVSRVEAKKLGLKIPGEKDEPAADPAAPPPPTLPGLNEGLQAQVKTMAPDIKQQLRDHIQTLRNRPRRTPEEAAREAAVRVRAKLLERQGQPPAPVPRVVDDGDSIRIE